MGLLDGLIDNIKRRLAMKFLGNLVRHGLTIVGGYLVASGMATQQAADAFVAANAEVATGVIAALIGLALSFMKDMK